jgi:hypothetical protein
VSVARTPHTTPRSQTKNRSIDDVGSVCGRVVRGVGPARYGGPDTRKRRGERSFFLCAALSVFRQALLVSKLAYAMSEIKGFSPLEAARQGLLASQRRTAAASIQIKRLAPADVAEATRMHVIDSQLQVLAATLDCVAFIRNDPSVGGRTLLIGYRGTGMLRDLVPDAELALNAPSIQRLDEARAFTKQVRAAVPDIPESRMHLYGHSLGGFIAEGVGNDYPQARTISVEPGAPVFGNMVRPRAFNAPAPGAALHTRLVRPNDPVSIGVRNLNNPETQITEPRTNSIDPLHDHFLTRYMPWLSGPDLGRQISVSFRWGIDRAKVQAAQAVKRFQDAAANLRV